MRNTTALLPMQQKKNNMNSTEIYMAEKGLNHAIKILEVSMNNNIQAGVRVYVDFLSESSTQFSGNRFSGNGVIDLVDGGYIYGRLLGSMPWCHGGVVLVAVLSILLS